MNFKLRIFFIFILSLLVYYLHTVSQNDSKKERKEKLDFSHSKKLKLRNREGIAQKFSIENV